MKALFTMMLVLVVGVNVAWGTVEVGSFRDLCDTTVPGMFVQSYLDVDVPEWTSVRFQDPCTKEILDFDKSGTIHVGFFNYVPNGIEFVGWAHNDNYYGNLGYPGLDGWVQGIYYSVIGDSQRPDDVMIVYDASNDGLGFAGNGIWTLGGDDVLFPSNQILFGPDMIRGDVGQLPVYDNSDAAILPDMIVSPIPEPATIALFGCGLVVASRRMRRRKK